VGGGYYSGDAYYGGVYGGYPIPNSTLYSPYGTPYLPVQPVIIIQREVIVPRTERQGESEYYLSPRESRKEESLSDALSDLRAAWMNGDLERFRARVAGEGRVRIYLRGAYKYSISNADFVQMTRDAMSRMDTTAFELDTKRLLADGRAFVAGKHTYRDADGEKREVYVSYALQKEGGRWKVVEAGSGSEAITRHED
jgi:hypothetical protein